MAMTEEFARLGKCPHCGEDLGIVIKDFLPQGYANVQLPPDKQQLIGVKTAPAQKMPLVKTIRAAGSIAYDPLLYQAEEEFIQAVKARKKAESGSIAEMAEQALGMMDAARTKLRLMGLSDDLIRELETQGKPDQSLLYSKAGGTVWLYASIYEYEIPYVKAGDKVNVEIPALPGKTVEGTVRSIDPVVDPSTRTVRIRAVLQNPEGLLKPEMYVNVTLRANLDEGIVVPDEAVFATGDKNLVFVTKPDGLFEPREVVLGIKTDGMQEIKSGIGDGEMVVTSGNFLIDSESRLRAVLESAGTSGEMHQHG